MAPGTATVKEIAKELADVVCQVYNSPSRHLLTVNSARRTVEDRLNLGDEFLGKGDWKAKSKQIIRETLVSRIVTWSQGHH